MVARNAFRRSTEKGHRHRQVDKRIDQQIDKQIEGRDRLRFEPPSRHRPHARPVTLHETFGVQQEPRPQWRK
jgi:hypothetical protein